MDRSKLTKLIRDIARCYILANRLSGLDAARQADLVEYSAREKCIAEFKTAFQGWMDDDIAGDMAFAARITDAPDGHFAAFNIRQYRQLSLVFADCGRIAGNGQ